jgi:flagellar biosynthesis GTPase FlhF
MHGYSSSEESEDPRRPRPQPANSNSNDQKKKKKKRLPPQQSINRTWKRFSSRKFSTTLSVLPFDPVDAPAIADRPNELLWDGYDRAAEECKRKVDKIVRDCKRVNMRYRDPGWDLDWDLKYEKGHCLNSLGTQKFELNRTTLLSSSATVPKAVKRVHEIFEKPTFMEKLDGGDVKQGSLGDCWIMAALTAMANTTQGIKRACVAYNTKIGIYGFVFYRDGEWIYSIIDDKLYLKSPCWDSPSMQRDLLQQIDREDVENVYRKTYQTGSKALFFAQCRDQSETWVPLIEKAYAKAHGDYAALSGGWIGEGLEDLSGGVTTELLTSDILDIDEFWDNEMSKVNEEFLFGCSTGLLEHGYGERSGITEGHAYVVMDARTLKSGQRLVKLRNPWGKIRKGIWEGAWSDGSKEWTTEVQEELGHKFSGDSVFWISYEDMIRKYTHFDRTRLFRDRDWRCCQRWIGVDVPWKAEYHEKFHIKLTQDSPLVLVLSQLDKRYWKGLHGQYSFRLHFRLHYQDQPQAEDYIVRSHGNYLMDRSVSVELPDMPAGNYVVYLKVTGERNSSAKSVEDVVKRELQEREENEKLAQVGYAYDLAHSKAWNHLDKVSKLRKKRDQKKASGCRQQERRRQWEKRHLNRDVGKKQSDKNKDKKQRRRDEWEARQLEKEDEEDRIEAERLAEEQKIAAVKAEAEAKAKAAEVKAAEVEAAEVEAKVTEAKAAEAEDKDAEADDEDDGDNPVEVVKPEPESEAKVQPEDSASDSSGSPQYTPKTEDSTPAPSNEEKQEVPPADGPPPAVDPTPAAPEGDAAPQKRRPRAQYVSEGDSSDSPVTDWEALYSSDDMVRKPRTTPQQPPQPKDQYDTEEEKMPAPWNAVCIVGIRVYSKDAELELRTVMEGGELLEDGMGEKGQADLDNAQANASGSRAVTAADQAAAAAYPSVVVRRGENELDDADDGTEPNSDIKNYIKIDSADSSAANTPEPTPMERDRQLERSS